MLRRVLVPERGLRQVSGMQIYSLGDRAMLAEVGTTADEVTLARVLAVARALAATILPGVTDIVPAFTTVTVHYEPAKIPPGAGAPIARVAEWLRVTAAGAKTGAKVAGREVEVPVCYGGEHGPDLQEVARRAGLTEAQATALHSSVRYQVAAVGFSPGFPYLLGLPPKLRMPRRATPRIRVPVGSVAIGGAQTGVYPFATPGGWQLIGRTPHRFFRPEAKLPALLYPGDTVRFKAITAAQWAAEAARDTPHPFDREKGVAPGVADKLAWLPGLKKLLPPGAGDPTAKAGPADRPATPDAVEMVRSGGLTTVQDLGRPGWQRVGVTPGGAMDRLAARVANLLLGNAEDAPVLESALTGPELLFHTDTWIAVTGATARGVPGWRPLRVAAGERLSLAELERGSHLYVAVAGGFAVPRVLGGAGTLLSAGFGGFWGRALRAGDRLAVSAPAANLDACSGGARWGAAREFWTASGGEIAVRFVRGRRWAAFDETARTAFKKAVWRVRPQSDRMGLRLLGPPLTAAIPGEILSEGVAFGTVQVPPSGQPIVLMADRQTLGGYPKIGHVIAADLPRLAQARPGDSVRFSEIPIAEAQVAAAEMEKSLELLRLGVAGRLGR
jgi:KipI family sensor histidine kinase inhibitor